MEENLLKNITIQVTDKDIERIKLGSELTGLSESAFIRSCIVLYLNILVDNDYISKIKNKFNENLVNRKW